MAEEEIKRIISAAIHEGCGADSVEQCGAGEFHDECAEDVFNALTQQGLLVISDA